MTSGLRLGTSAATTRGLRVPDIQKVAHLVADVLDGLVAHCDDNGAVEAGVRSKVEEIAQRFPIYPQD